MRKILRGELIPRFNVLALDTETTGLSWESKPYMLSTYDGIRSRIFDLRDEFNCVRAGIHLLKFNYFIGANTWFDLRMLVCHKILTKEFVASIHVRDVLRDNYVKTGVWAGLKETAKQVLGVMPNARDAQFDAMRNLHPRCNHVYALTHGYEVWDVTAEYCKQDSIMAWNLAKALPQSDTRADKLTLMQTLTGVRISKEFAQRCSRQLRKVGNEITCKHGAIVCSPKQIAARLGTRKADKETLKKLQRTDELANDVLSYRETAKLADMFDGIVKQTDRYSRVHPLLSWACATGRASCKCPNLQNLHSQPVRGMVLRNVVLADEGQNIVCADYSGIELVLFAHLADCKQIISWLNSGQDAHSNLTELVFGGKNAFQSVKTASNGRHTDKEIEEALHLNGDSVVQTEKALSCSRSRSINKRLMFATIYGAQAQKVSSILSIKIAEARMLLRRLHRALPELRHTQNFLSGFASKHGYVVTMTDRRIDCDSPHKAMNRVIQATAADIIRKALVDVDLWLTDNNMGRVLLTVHDELIASIVATMEKRCGEQMTHLMTKAAKRLCGIPISAEYVIHGSCWNTK